MSKKKIIFAFVIACIFNSFIEATFSQTLLKGGITTTLEKGHTITISLNTPINFYYSQEGDNIVAFIKEDVLIDKDFYIPKGSRLEGTIIKINEPKRFGLDGSFEIDFNEVVTPDNIPIPIFVSVSTDELKKEEKIADVLSYDSALITYGAFHGLIAGLQYGGLPLAVASHGISVLAGVAFGAGAGVIGSVMRKGKIPTAVTGINKEVKLKTNLYVFGELPKEETKNQKQETQEEYTGFRFFPSPKEEEVELEINTLSKNYSDAYGSYFVLEFNLKNKSDRIISLSDFVLLSDIDEEPLHPDLFLSGKEALKTVKPSSGITTSLAFLILDNKMNKPEHYSLAIVDPLDRKVIVKIPLKGINN